MSNIILSGKNPKKVKVGNLVFGGEKPIIISGPCSVESREQIIELAIKLKAIGVDVLRGGAFKPRTSPYSFQGLGEEGLKYLKEASEITGIPVISELMDASNIDLICKYADIIQIGSRNMHNYSLLKAVGELNKPVLLKRGMSATIKEWILAAEYIAHHGNDNIILCERGIRTFDNYTRNTLDLAAVPIMKKETGLPVIVDPSHGTGIRELIIPMSLAALAAGADGIMVEVHEDPDNALSDGEQSLDIEQYENLMKLIKK
ncbi:MAG: 3-deoxy-7-phosphoheptulonate synthase [Clostridiales bacterium]|nr:3-deoxy-7-phosphoheptulonate synthase [Clostridiales bacterium]